MTIRLGARLGAYEVLGPLGAGRTSSERIASSTISSVIEIEKSAKAGKRTRRHQGRAFIPPSEEK